jgi:hypothetical protein
MSENLKKLRDEEARYDERRPKKVAQPTKTMEELESQAEEARKEEQRIKEELNKATQEQTKAVQRTKEEIKQRTLESLRAYIRLLVHALDDERAGLGMYNELIRNAISLGDTDYDRRELEIILAEEKQHKTRLESLIAARERDFKKLTYTKYK